MQFTHSHRPRGFTLLETVIAIGVLAVLLTGFMLVFAPAAEGIRKTINIQQADRLASTLEQELVTLRATEKSADINTGFDKAFYRIKDSTGPINATGKDSGDPDNALLVYQYRGKVSDLRSDDGTPKPEKSRTGAPGETYVVVSMMRRKGDPLFNNPTTGDISAIEGGVFLVKCVQLVFKNGNLQVIDQDATDKNLRGKIKNPKPVAAPSTDLPGPFNKPVDYPEAVIAFSADFYMVPTNAVSYFGISGKFVEYYEKAKTPVFTRNLAVRR